MAQGKIDSENIAELKKDVIYMQFLIEEIDLL